MDLPILAEHSEATPVKFRILSLALALPSNARLSAPETNSSFAQGGSRFPHVHKEILSPEKFSPQEAVSAAFFLLCPEMMLVQTTESPGARCHTR